MVPPSFLGYSPPASKKIQSLILESCDNPLRLLAIGARTSPGDCNRHTPDSIDFLVGVENLNKVVFFDKNSGEICIESGATIKEVSSFLSSSGWGLKVLPSSNSISIGGAVSADVFGFNHPSQGSFSDSIRALSFLGADGLMKEIQKGDPLFLSVCGGYGLMGIIQYVTLSLRRTPSPFICVDTFRLSSLREMLKVLETSSFEFKKGTIDFNSLSMSVSHGDLCTHGTSLSLSDKLLLKIDTKIKSFSSSKATSSLMPALKDAYTDLSPNKRIILFSSFAHPQEYSSSNLIHFHFSLPFSGAEENLSLIFDTIKASGKSPIRDVDIRVLGKENSCFLSFPSPGFSVNIRFPYEKHKSPLFSKLSSLVTSFSGRVYLAKDLYSSEEDIVLQYPKCSNFQIFRSFREWGDCDVGPKNVFASSFSSRLNL